MAFYDWSKTAASNATASSTVNWAEGQAPSSVNDSARAMMADTAKYRDDITGSITTGGTSTGYTVASNQGFSTLAKLNNMVVAFTPHTTCGSTVTLNVDGLGAKPLRTSPSTELQSGALVQGTPYVAMYNNTDGVFYLQSFYGNPYGVPIGGGMVYFGSSLPNSSFAFPNGQAVSRTTYAALFAVTSTTYGPGDGTTTFNLPDLTGRVPAMKEAAASRLTATYFGANSTNLGATGGLENDNLALTNLPPQTFAVTGTAGSGFAGNFTAAGTIIAPAFAGGGASANGGTLTVTGTASSTGQNSTGIRTVQPTIITNYIMRII